MDNATCFELNIKNGVAHLNMNRPDKFNSMTRLFWKELPEIIKEIDKTIRESVQMNRQIEQQWVTNNKK